VTQVEVLTTWGEWAMGAAFWTCLLWPGIAAVFWPWHRSQWGWNMVIKTELIAVALLAPVLRAELGVTSLYFLLWTTVVALTLIPVVVGWRLVIIWRTQRDGARDGPPR